MYGQQFPSHFFWDFCCRFLAFVKIDGYCPLIHIVVLFRPRSDSEAQLQLEHDSCPYLACPLANAFGILDLKLKSITSFIRQGFSLAHTLHGQMGRSIPGMPSLLLMLK
jgi:hypothetical protein